MYTPTLDLEWEKVKPILRAALHQSNLNRQKGYQNCNARPVVIKSSSITDRIPMSPYDQGSVSTLLPMLARKNPDDVCSLLSDFSLKMVY
jgi:hypothetical protein